MIDLISIVGPTACCKTKLSLVLAKKFNGEIINADSMQIYKEMYIGVDKIKLSKTKNIKHHLLDFLPVSEGFSVFEFVALAREVIKKINNKNKLPILCGGTGLYIDSVIQDNSFLGNSRDNKIRRELEKKAEEPGKSLLSELYKVDSETAAKLHENDKKRIIRALEIYYKTSKTISFQNEISKKNKKIYNTCKIGLTFYSRENLYKKINLRVEKMIKKGLENEARKIFSLNPSKTARAAIGYKEFFDYFEDKISFLEAVEKIKTNTSHYAKRQLAWFKKDKDISWIFIDKEKNFEKIISKAENIISSFEAKWRNSL